ncbi:MAG TPA: pantoate--beta-alanine ligase [Methylophilus sp.]|nr:pantoate--beta-alanine ligase [Methylophilus sp.]HQQ33170.1 pantoate--beta-alanine ligase [Methylophilus sp.]
MRIIHTIAELRAALALQGSQKSSQKNVAFVPTMGNLHAGHISLVEIARQHAKTIVVSIFVNPLQFGANEDFGKYPRTLEADCEQLQAAEADIVFAPSVEEMYPDFDGKQLNQTMTIMPPPMANTLCGASRPGHFAGVATVVAKLFNIVQPAVAVFGKKDFQQLLVIKELVKQFNLPIEIIAGETTREADGLAMSSRNGYLSQLERQKAVELRLELRRVVEQIASGNRNFASLENDAENILRDKGWLVDYVAVRSAHDLAQPSVADKNLVVLGAAKLGNTRLIDNIEVTLN